jgi:glycosyltransferase involved in cell wall biosynthesis
MKSTISVVVTAYNRRDFLLSALKSVNNQSFKDYEIIVVKNFHDQAIDNFIKKHGSKEIFINAKRYGKQVTAALPPTSRTILPTIINPYEEA